MKITCTKTNLQKGLSNSIRLVGGGNTLPVLNNILLKTDGGRLKLSTTNLELAINTWVGGKIEEEGEITIPAKLLSEYINNLAAEQVVLSSKNNTLTLEANGSKTHINGLPSEEFPLIPKIEEKRLTKISSGEVKSVIGEVVFAASFSETQPEISGVFLNFHDKSLILAATDRYRLAEGKIELLESVVDPQEIILPAKAVVELGRLTNQGEIEVYLAEGQVLFKQEDGELISRLIDGKYPDYKQIIPTDFLSEATVGRQKLIQTIKAVSLFAEDNNNIHLDISPTTKQVLVKSGGGQTGDSEIKLSAKIVGQKNDIIFNYRYILECLNNLPDEEVVIKLIDASSPAQIVPLNQTDYQYIVMPIKL